MPWYLSILASLYLRIIQTNTQPDERLRAGNGTSTSNSLASSEAGDNHAALELGRLRESHLEPRVPTVANVVNAAETPELRPRPNGVPPENVPHIAKSNDVLTSYIQLKGRIQNSSKMRIKRLFRLPTEYPMDTVEIDPPTIREHLSYFYVEENALVYPIYLTCMNVFSVTLLFLLLIAGVLDFSNSALLALQSCALNIFVGLPVTSWSSVCVFMGLQLNILEKRKWVFVLYFIGFVVAASVPPFLPLPVGPLVYVSSTIMTICICIAVWGISTWLRYTQ